jgi:hypothetical protein
VGTDLAWHEEFAGGIPLFVVGVLCQQRLALPNRIDHSSLVAHGSIEQDTVV